MLTSFQLLSGANIPYSEAQLVIHQPTLKQIGILGQDAFFKGCQVWRFTKDNLPLQDRINLSQVSNFDIIMSILKAKNPDMVQTVSNAIFVLSLFFPDYSISLDNEQGIILERQQEKKIINSSNFDTFKQLLGEIICLNDTQSEAFKTDGEFAQRIAEKLRRGRQKKAQLKKSEKKISILTRYASILSIGAGISLVDIMNYTMFQLFDGFKRYGLKSANDLFIQQKMAGAKNVKAGQNWMSDLYQKNKEDDDFAKFVRKHR